MNGFLTLVPALGALCLLLDFLVQPQCDDFSIFLIYFVISVCCLLEPCDFLRTDRKGVDLEGRRGGKRTVKSKIGGPVSRTYYMRN